jgi:tRNA (guanosine-2'-O-)-methyltransferase
VIRSLSPLLTRRRLQRIERVLRRRLVSVTVVLEQIFDPHNAAAVLRTCEALGLQHVHVVRDSGERGIGFSRRVTRSAHNWLEIYCHDSIEACLEQLSGWGFERWAAVPPQPSPGPQGAAPPAPDPARPAALVFGNEHSGLSPAALAACPGRLVIPMFGFTESFNLSVSVALALGRVTEARRRWLGQPGDLDDEQLKRLRAGYYAASAQHAAKVIIRQL